MAAFCFAGRPSPIIFWPRQVPSTFFCLVRGEAENTALERAAQPDHAQLDWRPYGVAVFSVAIATGVGFLIDFWLPLPNISVAFLLAVLLIAMRLGRGPAIFASIVSFLSYDFFFTAPRFAFAVSDSRNLLTLFFFLVAAVIVSNLAGRVRRQVDAAKTNARRTQNLYEFSRKIAVAPGRDEVLWAVVHHVASTIRGRSLILLPKDEQLEIAAGYPPEDRLNERDAAAAAWTWGAGKPSGRGSTTLPAAEWLFLPLKTVRGPLVFSAYRWRGRMPVPRGKPSWSKPWRIRPPWRLSARPWLGRCRSCAIGEAKLNGCALPCSPPSRMTCGHRWFRSWAPQPACLTITTRSAPKTARTWPRRSRRG